MTGVLVVVAPLLISFCHRDEHTVIDFSTLFYLPAAVSTLALLLTAGRSVRRYRGVPGALAQYAFALVTTAVVVGCACYAILRSL